MRLTLRRISSVLNKFCWTFSSSASQSVMDTWRRPVRGKFWVRTRPEPNGTVQSSTQIPSPRPHGQTSHCMFSLAAERTEGAIRFTFPLVLFNISTPKLTNAATEWNFPDLKLDRRWPQQTWGGFYSSSHRWLWPVCELICEQCVLESTVAVAADHDENVPRRVIKTVSNSQYMQLLFFYQVDVSIHWKPE